MAPPDRRAQLRQRAEHLVPVVLGQVLLLHRAQVVQGQRPLQQADLLPVLLLRAAAHGGAAAVCL